MDTFDTRQHHSLQRNLSRGFSLIELLVCITIISVISAVVLARYKTFNSTILLRDLAYEVALSIREAQVYGVSVRGIDGMFNESFGMHFVNGTSYSLFADTNDNLRYDTGEQISTYTITQKNAIVNLYANTSQLTTLDVMFTRPEPDSVFHTVPSVSSVDSVRVIVGSPDGSMRTVRVWPTGQITIE